MTNFSFLEGMIGMGIAEFLQDYEISSILRSQISLRQNLDFIGALYHAKVTDDYLLKTFDTLILKISEAEDERNKIIHSHWMQPTGENQALRIKSIARRMKPKAGQRQAYTSRQLNEFANTLPELGFEFWGHMMFTMKSQRENTTSK